MTVDEAHQVLATDGKEFTEALIKERFDLLHKLNAAGEESAGSPYLQGRITA